MCIDHWQLWWGSSGSPCGTGTSQGESGPSGIARLRHAVWAPAAGAVCWRCGPGPTQPVAGKVWSAQGAADRSPALRALQPPFCRTGGVYLHRATAGRETRRALPGGRRWLSLRQGAGRGFSPAGRGGPPLRFRSDQHPKFPAVPPTGEQHPGARSPQGWPDGRGGADAWPPLYHQRQSGPRRQAGAHHRFSYRQSGPQAPGYPGRWRVRGGSVMFRQDLPRCRQCGCTAYLERYTS